jgi:hypothetical protein
MLVAQAWWDAAYNATTAQRQSPARHGLGQGAPGVRCAVAITGMQDDRVRQRRPRGAMLSRTTTMEVGIGIGALRAEPPGLLRRPGHVLVGNLKGVGRVYRQTFIDTYAVARPRPSQATASFMALIRGWRNDTISRPIRAAVSIALSTMRKSQKRPKLSSIFAFR